MFFEQILTLSLLQGLTEFLPISSSAHLVLLPRFVSWEDQGLAFDVALHLGSLLAVVFYFRKDLVQVARGIAARVVDRKANEHSRLAGLIVIATIPVCLTGLPLGSFVDGWIRVTPARTFGVISLTTLGFGLLLWLADRRHGNSRDVSRIRVRDAIWIGLAQSISPIPGTSRSGVTVTAALFRGLDRRSAVRFSFLLSIPTISLAGGYQAYKLLQESDVVDWTALGMGVGLSAISAYLCIHFLLKIIERVGMMPFVLYRVALSIVLVVFWAQAARGDAA